MRKSHTGNEVIRPQPMVSVNLMHFTDCLLFTNRILEPFLRQLLNRLYHDIVSHIQSLERHGACALILSMPRDRGPQRDFKWLSSSFSRVSTTPFSGFQPPPNESRLSFPEQPLILLPAVTQPRSRIERKRTRLAVTFILSAD